MNAQETLQSVYSQIISLRKKGLRPTVIIVGEDVFVKFVNECNHNTMQDALGVVRKPATMMGVTLFRVFEDQPFTVLTDGSSEK